MRQRRPSWADRERDTVRSYPWLWWLYLAIGLVQFLNGVVRLDSDLWLAALLIPLGVAFLGLAIWTRHVARAQR